MREDGGHDPEHGARAAELAHELRDAGAFHLDEKQMALVERALIEHDRARRPPMRQSVRGGMPTG